MAPIPAPDEIRRDVSVRSKADLTTPKRHFRSNPNNGHLWTGPTGPFSAKPGNRRTLFDHLVGAGKDYRRQLDAQRFCDPEVDPEIELGGTFERQVAWLCAFQNAIKL